MPFMSGFAEVRQAREVPKAPNVPLPANLWANGTVLGHAAQDPFVQSMRVLAQAGVRAWPGQAGN